MKNKIHKILGVGITLVIAMALVMGFAAPVAASPAETINEWYKFEYPVPGADGDWLYDPSILRLGEITEAIDGTLYVHVQRCVPDADFNISTGTLAFTEFDYLGTATDTGTITADIDGTWSVGTTAAETTAFEAAFLPTDFVASLKWGFDLDLNGSIDVYLTSCVNGTATATNLSFTGSIESMTDSGNLTTLATTYPPASPATITGGVIYVDKCGFNIHGGGLNVVIEEGFSTSLGSSIFKSTDGARTWEDTGFPGGFVVDMAASSLDADVLYVADGHYVYSTEDAGDEWCYVGKDSIEEQLAGYCGIPACCDCCSGRKSPPPIEECCPSCWECSGEYPFTCPITSIDVTYDDSDNPYVFIGTRNHCVALDLDNDNACDLFPGNVYWISETAFPSSWSDLGLPCYGGGGYDALAVGCAPDWADSKQTYVTVSDGTETHVVYTTGGPCEWIEGSELLYNCATGNHFGSRYASRIAFPDDWEDTETLFVGVTDCYSCSKPTTTDITTRTGGPGGDVYMVIVTSPVTPAIDMNVLGISSGCVGLQPVDIISLDIEGDTDEASLIAGSFCCNEVYCSTDGGWSWDASDKDPTGGPLFAPLDASDIFWWGGHGPTLTYAIWYEDTALAATAGCECAVSECCGEEYPCEFWTQKSLISTGIDCVRSIGHSPGYVCGDTETMYMLTDWAWCDYWDEFWDTSGCTDCCCFPCQLCEPTVDGARPTCYDDTQSMWRHDGEYWERVYSSTIAGANVCCESGDPTKCTPAKDIFQSLQVSSDFNDTGVVYLWNGCFEMWRTTDTGCSWDKLTFPCAPRPCISAAIVIDEDTVIAGGGSSATCCTSAQGYVRKTTRHGARPWDAYEYNVTNPTDVVSFALEPGYEDPGLVLLGDNSSRVFISEEGGEEDEWSLVGTGTTTGCQAILESTNQKTYVAFDPAYATSGIIYAAAGDVIARCVVDPDEDWEDQEWEGICGDEAGDGDFAAAGIQAAGDTVLYVTDSTETDDTHSPSTVTATLGTCVAVADTDYISDTGGVLRSVNPDEEDAEDVIFERIAKGLPVGLTTQSLATAELYGLWLTCDTSEEGCAENVLWALDSGDPYGTPEVDPCKNIWVYEDTLAQPVALAMPIDEQKMATTEEVTLSWNELCGADCYQVSLEKYCPECPEDWIAVDIVGLDCAPGPCCTVCAPAEALDLCVCPAGACVCTTDTCIVVEDLEPGSEYRWKIRVCGCQPALSKWSEERSFSTALEAVDWGPCSPVCGSQDIILTPNFSWGAVTGATGYDIQLAPTETFTAGVIRGSSTVNAWVAPEDLEYGTTYYWRVRAEKDGVFSDWMVCLFTTMEKPVEPPPPVTITPAPPAPTITIPPAQMITPNWIYAVIGIGAALIVVVIVLIVRTRRTPA